MDKILKENKIQIYEDSKVLKDVPEKYNEKKNKDEDSNDISKHALTYKNYYIIV